MRFYTTPTHGIKWPYIMANFNNSWHLAKRKYEHGILDCGIEIFQHVSEYPKGYLRKYAARALQLSKARGIDKVWAVIPDYCDDLSPGLTGDNVERTLGNIEYFLTEYNTHQVNWVPALQAKLHDRLSFTRSVSGLQKLWSSPPRIAIGTVCKSRNLKFIEWCMRYARSHFPKAWIHAFGLTLSALPRVVGLLDSWDSAAWTWPRRPLSEGFRQASTKAEKVQYFHNYIEAIEAKLAQTNYSENEDDNS